MASTRFILQKVQHRLLRIQWQQAPAASGRNFVTDSELSADCPESLDQSDAANAPATAAPAAPVISPADHCNPSHEANLSRSAPIHPSPSSLQRAAVVIVVLGYTVLSALKPRSSTSRDREGAGGMEPRMDTNEHECGRAKLRLSRSMFQHSMARLEHRAPTGKADQGPGAAGQQAANRFQPGQGRCTSRLRVR